MVHVKWPSPSFKIDLDHENDNIMKNGFYQRVLQPTEHPKRVGQFFFYFFKTLLDGPLRYYALNFQIRKIRRSRDLNFSISDSFFNYESDDRIEISKFKLFRINRNKFWNQPMFQWNHV